LALDGSGNRIGLSRMADGLRRAVVSPSLRRFPHARRIIGKSIIVVLMPKPTCSPVVLRMFDNNAGSSADEAGIRPLFTEYRALALANVMRYATRRQMLCILGIWLVLTVICVGLGLLTVTEQWSGLPLNFGGVDIYVSVYPPLVICMLLTLCLGWWWGAIPAYISTLVLALYSGMPGSWANLFAFADPLGLAVMVIGYRAIPTDRSLRHLRDWFFFVQMSFVSSIFSSSGALIWCYTNHIDTTGLLPIWQGWWLGGFLHNVLIAAPLLALCWPFVDRWQARHPQLLSASSGNPRRLVLGLVAAVSIGVVAYGLATIQLSSGQATQAATESWDALRHATVVLQQTMWVFFWIFTAIIVFFAGMGYQLYIHWQRATDLLLAKLQQSNDDLELMASTDGMTGLLNRRVADASMEREWLRAMRSHLPASLAILDIDNFKRINDCHGHPAGDAVIRHLADAIRFVMRETDTAARIGGEEFLIIMPDTDGPGAAVFAERLREHVMAHAVPYGEQELHFTVSIGVADMDPADLNYSQWLSRADQALLAAKNAGRNRVQVAANSGVATQSPSAVLDATHL